MVKRCAWGTCKSDFRYPEHLFRKPEGIQVTFHYFSLEKRHKEQREAWTWACCADRFVCKDSYICSLHFERENGPNEENPDLISATASQKKASYANL